MKFKHASWEFAPRVARPREGVAYACMRCAQPIEHSALYYRAVHASGLVSNDRGSDTKAICRTCADRLVAQNPTCVITFKAQAEADPDPAPELPLGDPPKPRRKRTKRKESA